MPKALRKWVYLGVGIVVATIGTAAFFSKPTIKYRALGGPIRIAEVDDSVRKRGFLGIDYDSAPQDQLASVGLKNGVVITRIVDGGPAALSGIEIGDFLTKVDDLPIRQPSDLRGASLQWRPGQVVRVTFVHRARAGPILDVADVRLISFNEIEQLHRRDE